MSAKRGELRAEAIKGVQDLRADASDAHFRVTRDVEALKVHYYGPGTHMGTGTSGTGHADPAKNTIMKHEGYRRLEKFGGGLRD